MVNRQYSTVNPKGDFPMTQKQTYEEPEQRIKELEKETGTTHGRQDRRGK